MLIAASAALPVSGQTMKPVATAIAAPLATLPEIPTAAAPGTLTGRFVYADGSPVNAVEVTLTPATGTALRTVTDDTGEYAFKAIPSGSFRLNAEAESLQSYSATGTMPSGGAALEMPRVTLQVEAIISVSAISQEQAAEIEVRSEEHQRILGAIPNFLVSYDAEPVPLSSAQKYRLTLRTLFDPANFAVSAIVAGGEMATGSYAGFGNGAAGYGRRLGASLGDGATNVLLTDGFLPSVLHQDPRYFYKGTGSFGSRLGYVVKQAFEQRGDNGRWQPAWSNTLGDVGSALISNTYYPHTNTGLGTVTGENFGLAIASQGIANMLQEFVFGRFTTRR